MGMIVELYTLSDENIRKVLADPPLVWKVIAPDDPEAYESARQEQSAGFFDELFDNLRPAMSQCSDLTLTGDECIRTDVDKSWHGIHYLLNLLTQTDAVGDAPLNFLVVGGEDVGKDEICYAPPRAFFSADVEAIRRALGPIDERVLRERFDPEQMNQLGIYPKSWTNTEEDFEYCAQYFKDLKAFIEHAAERGLGLILTLS